MTTWNETQVPNRQTNKQKLHKTQVIAVAVAVICMHAWWFPLYNFLQQQNFLYSTLVSSGTLHNIPKCTSRLLQPGEGRVSQFFKTLSYIGPMISFILLDVVCKNRLILLWRAAWKRGSLGPTAQKIMANLHHKLAITTGSSYPHFAGVLWYFLHASVSCAWVLWTCILFRVLVTDRTRTFVCFRTELEVRTIVIEVE